MLDLLNRLRNSIVKSCEQAPIVVISELSYLERLVQMNGGPASQDPAWDKCFGPVRTPNPREAWSGSLTGPGISVHVELERDVNGMILFVAGSTYSYHGEKDGNCATIRGTSRRSGSGLQPVVCCGRQGERARPG